MRERDKEAAQHFGILDRLQKLEADLLAVKGITDVTFDVDNYDELHEVCILTRYDIPPSAEEYFTQRRSQLDEILQTCLKHDLFPSVDRIEDYGEHWYIVRRCGKSWPRPQERAAGEAAEPLIQLNAEWIPYMKAYRLYDPHCPQQTVAYVDTLEEAERPGYRIVEVDADTMHVECF